MRTQKVSSKGNVHKIIGCYKDRQPAYFDEICDGVYDYTLQNGYNNLGAWIEFAAKAHGK
ncbi:MAG: hypothetical protein RR071_08745 [Lachnospiraceae bacterium]